MLSCSSDGGSRPGSPPPAPPPVQVPDALSMPPPPPPAETSHHEQTTLLHNEDESFALAPVDASALKGMEMLVIAMFFTGYEMDIQCYYQFFLTLCIYLVVSSQ